MRKILVCLLVAGCAKSEAPSPSRAPAAIAKSAPAAPTLQVPIGGGGEPPSLPFTISKVYEKQKPLDKAPWHEAGGEWTFFDAEAGGGHFTVGSFARAPKDPSLAGFGGFGEAMIAVPSPDDGARVAAAFARGFHVTLPAPGARGPVNALRFSTAVLGNNVARSAEGGFGGAGSWTAFKWFLDCGNVEVFFNFIAADLRSEFSEKDADYDKSVAAALAHGLRDGAPSLKKN